MPGAVVELEALAALVSSDLASPPRRLCEIGQVTDVASGIVARECAIALIGRHAAEPIGDRFLLATFAGVDEAVSLGLRTSPRVIDLDAAARAVTVRMLEQEIVQRVTRCGFCGEDIIREGFGAPRNLIRTCACTAEEMQ